ETVRTVVVRASDVGEVTEVLGLVRLGLDARHGAGGVGDLQLRTVGGGDDGAGPHVERRQVQVEVEHFAAVQGFEEANLDGLGLVGGVDHRNQGGLVVTDGVVRVDQDLAEAVRIDVYRGRDVR